MWLVVDTRRASDGTLPDGLALACERGLSCRLLFQRECFRAWALHEGIENSSHLQIEEGVRFLALGLGLRFNRTGKLQELIAATEIPSNDFLSSLAEGLLIIFDKQTRMISALTDSRASYPFYYSRTPDGIVGSGLPLAAISRRDELSFDTEGIAQALVFGTPLAEKTLLRGISFLPPSHLLQQEAHPVAPLDFSAENGRGLPQRDAQDLALQTLDGVVAEECESEDSSLLLLSGGTDSWLVGKMLLRRGREPLCVSFFDGIGRGWREAEIAAQRAADWELDFEPIQPRPDNGKVAADVLSLFCGLRSQSYADRAYIALQLKETFPDRRVVWTGDTGFYRRPLCPYRFTEEKEAFRWLFARGGKFTLMPLFSPSEACALTGVDEKSFFAGLGSVIHSYREGALDRKLAHFAADHYVFRMQALGREVLRLTHRPRIPLESEKMWRTSLRFSEEQRAVWRPYYFFENDWEPEDRTSRLAAQLKETLFRRGKSLPGWEGSDQGGALDEPLDTYLRRHALETITALSRELRLATPW